MAALKRLNVEGFVAFQQRLDWKDHTSLNVIIGENDTGKTHLLKLLYAMTRAIEEHAKKQAGPEPKELSELLASKLRWTFLPQKMELGRLVSRGAGQRLSVELCWNAGGYLKFGFGKDTTVRINELQTNGLPELNGHKASFLPPKEILSIFDAIVATRESQELASFDDTYYDLVQDYRQPTLQGKLQSNIKTALDHLKSVTGGGEVEMTAEGSIVFRRGSEVFNMHQTAEGIKKIGILSRLMRNRRLTPSGGCVLFVDEPEVNLHPKAIVLFAEMLHEYAQSGIQVYLTTHSYFLLKRLEQLARAHKTDYTLLDLRRAEGGGVTGLSSRLSKGLPMNPIVEESLRLFDRDVELELGS
ncbi:AAA family ATPase [Calidifontimicrobium sp. SYSU G02091]|uniref:AAA family ATPase n=1 Tax=Calidifontimicrobium sp. SYSU G02091 TaxID=2926421 RepID=UPI001F534277|nr:AAA family ATPase [Calidifontimicrobium sp. SYSU G02091]MCI1192606.1 AAA family ATPase [Calidifontimicrobium sp. SYSU G02091]